MSSNRSQMGTLSLKYCARRKNSADGLRLAEATKFSANGKERILSTQLMTKTDLDKYGTLIKDYNRESLVRINKYPKTL